MEPTNVGDDRHFCVADTFGVSETTKFHADIAATDNFVQNEGAGEKLLPTMLSAVELACYLQQPVKRVETFLRRYCEDHPDSRIEVDTPRKGEPRYLYRTADVWPVLLVQRQSWSNLATD